MIKENNFWEQFSDHMMIAISAFLLGMYVCVWLATFMLRWRIKFEYDIPRHTMMRMIHEDKKWIIIKPDGIMQMLDTFLLCFFDKGHDKYIDKHDKNRIRIIRVIVLTILFLLVLSGCLLILSAFAWSMNPFDYINMYREAKSS